MGTEQNLGFLSLLPAAQPPATTFPLQPFMKTVNFSPRPKDLSPDPAPPGESLHFGAFQPLPEHQRGEPGAGPAVPGPAGPPAQRRQRERAGRAGEEHRHQM